MNRWTSKWDHVNSYLTGSWSTVDPLWPREASYGYVGGRAVLKLDPTGRQARCQIVPLVVDVFRDLDCVKLGAAAGLGPNDGFPACIGGQCKVCLPTGRFPIGSVARTCAGVHEEEHCRQFRKGEQKCIPVPGFGFGTVGGGSSLGANNETECVPSILALRCLRKNAPKHNPCLIPGSTECSLAYDECWHVFVNSAPGGLGITRDCWRYKPEDLCVMCSKVLGYDPCEKR
jgi:hypothetical protein